MAGKADGLQQSLAALTAEQGRFNGALAAGCAPLEALVEKAGRLREGLQGAAEALEEMGRGDARRGDAGRARRPRRPVTTGVVSTGSISTGSARFDFAGAAQANALALPLTEALPEDRDLTFADPAAEIERNLRGAFRRAGQALRDFVETGRVDLRGLAAGLLERIGERAFEGLLGRLEGAVFDRGGGVFGGSGLGGSARAPAIA